MEQRGSAATIIIIVLLIILAGIAGAAYYTFILPAKEFERAETPDTSINTNEEGLFQKSEVREKGFNAGILIAPSVNDVISGIVTVSAVDTPKQSKHVGFSISKKFDDLGKGGPNLGIDSDGMDGWGVKLDTSEYENGLYYLAIFAFENDTTSNPLGVANVQVEIRN